MFPSHPLAAAPLRAGALALLLGLGGCHVHVTQDNYARLKVGQTYDQVVAVLGSPDRCDDALVEQHCFWGSVEKRISIDFLDGKVVQLNAQGLHK